MTKNINKILLVFLFIIISNCGYKILDNAETNNFNIKEINSFGDKRINFKIKNSLIVDSMEDRTNNLILELDTKKIKKIKEKNIKNEITKYEISLISNIKLNFLEKNQKHSFSIISTGDYLASDRYSTTLKNEKRLVEDLTNDLSSKIKNRINLVTNDF